MKQLLSICLAVLLLLIAVGSAMAVTSKVQITEFTVVGSENAKELKNILKSLLSSRIASSGLLVVDDAAGVSATVSGGYTSFGGMFSVDATVKSASGEVVGQRYVQGGSQDELIPAIGRLAELLRVLLPTPALPVVAALPLPVASKVASGGDIVRVADSPSVVQQTRIEGALNGIAPGRQLPGNEREFLVVDNKKVYLYRQKESLKKISEYAVTTGGRILGVDTADVDNDGALEAYITVVDREELVSVALSITEQGFVPIATNLPFFFKAVGMYGQSKKLLAQYAGRGADDFYGDICAVVKNGAKYSLGEPVKLPKNAHIFSFNMFLDGEGKPRIAYIDVSGELRIADSLGKELWKGADHFGGSELYFLRDEQQMQNVSLDRYRWRFIDQRITVTSGGEIIIPRNSGLLSIGNNRSYSKNSVYSFVWNGAALVEQWHTKESPSYLADYYFDAERNEVVALEHVQKEGMFTKGASVILIKKTDR